MAPFATLDKMNMVSSARDVRRPSALFSRTTHYKDHYFDRRDNAREPSLVMDRGCVVRAIVRSGWE